MTVSSLRARPMAIAIAFVLASATPVGGADSLVPSEDDWSQREAIAAELAPLQAVLRRDHADSFGGLWIDEAGKPVIAIVGENVEAVDLSLGSGLSKDPRIVFVEESEAALDRLHAHIVASADQEFMIGSIQLAGVETDIANNRVNIVAVGASEDALRVLRATFGGLVSTSSVDLPSVGLACSNANCPSPLKGGLKLYRNGQFACMSGFVFRYAPTSTYYLSTAGHCSNVGDTYQHPSGVARGSVTHQGWTDNSAADVSLFPISSAQKSNQLCGGPNCNINAITSRENPASGAEVIGESACATKQTITNCGTLVSVNNTISVCKSASGPCKVILWLRRATFTSNPGDSGGAVYSGHKAMGLISANYPGSTNTVYSHVINVEFRFGMSVQITP